MASAMSSDNFNMKPEIREEVERFVATMGGVGTVVRELRESREFSIRVQSEIPALMEKYPDKWIAMSKDGNLFVGDSIEEVLDAVDSQGTRRKDVTIEFMDTDPVPLIL